jgi:putative exosortase-associated protein (TIGR04073 family)
MKRLAGVFVLLLALSIYIGAYAEEASDDGAWVDSRTIDYTNSAVNKLGRGIINTATCWAEIPGQIAEVSRKQDPVIGWTLGLVEGTCTALVRGVTGIVDILTFAAPPYDKPNMKPEYALTSADEKIKKYLW